MKEFRRQTNATTLTYAWETAPNAPFSRDLLARVGPLRSRAGETAASLLLAAEEFRPDAVLVSGWQDAGYVAACRQLKRKGIPVISGCDTQWKGTVRQRVAGIVAPWHVQRFIDVLWVTGERQRWLAHRLGYRGDRCWSGFYACDVDAFAPAAAVDRGSREPAFLFVGRYVSEKGIDTLAAAYAEYRRRVAAPWKLVCAGAGALRDRLIACGAEDRGFVQPPALPALMAEATAFVLPSTFEPWGVVLQEAAAAGLPLLASNACGASVHLLRSGFNGFAFEPLDSEGLTQAMVTTQHLSALERRTMGEASGALAKQFTPALWASCLEQGIRRLTAA
jgi:glycosyltransferase involved in cell wall biosynthesis